MMKRLLSTLSIVLVLNFSALAQDAGPAVCTEEYVELMGIVARLADNSIFNEDYAPVYQADIEKYFSTVREHAAVRWLKEMQNSHGLTYDAIPWLGAHLIEKDGAFGMFPNCDPTYKRWSSKDLKAFLPLLHDFYIESNFNEFYRDHQPTYENAVETFRKNISDNVDTDWFGSFFSRYAGEKAVSYHDNLCQTIIICLNNGAGSFGVQRQKPGQKHEIISVMLYGTDDAGNAIYDSDGSESLILIHEFCHSFITVPKSLKSVGKSLLEEHREKLASVGYGIWENIIEESFVRASVIRYMIDHDFEEDYIRAWIGNEHEYYGFVWLPEDTDWYRGNIFSLFDNLE